MPGLREKAEADMTKILNSDAGFAWPIKVTDPAGTIGNLKGFSNDIADLIDPDTGQAVSGRHASVALSVSDLIEKGLGKPVGIADGAKKPWLIGFDDINGEAYVFKVLRSMPDRGLGLITCILEFYE